ncbi:hypothetical protein SeMB42_g01981 [Synchytrium endobioticum]|uniref:Association with the SNF1 complex (ASC) domain-containing protein n=1 Tax=Synchytrium endobioticum TaxID=286115 RepID=A0A507DK79_9FUNG|nr:hypothetical protein SeLEV6574_g00439 [Synchytrium endobioticum]TPX51298.1 hypothetical protein SeMB42_g01981 [Synchytrium endobioticum]
MGNGQSQQQDRQPGNARTSGAYPSTQSGKSSQQTEDWSTSPTSPSTGHSTNHHSSCNPSSNSSDHHRPHSSASTSEAMFNDTTTSLLRPPSTRSLKPRETIPVTITYLSRDAQHIHPPKPIVIKQPEPIITRAPYTPPSTERSYRNSSRIVHAFGVGGLAPLAPLARGDDPARKKAIPIMINWNGGGRTVYITGTFNNWKQKIRMFKSNADFTTVIDMPPGTHRLKFIVDDEWKCSEDLPVASDADGNLVNFLDVEDEDGRHQNDGLDSLAGDEAPPPLSPLSNSPESTYSCEIPAYLTRPSSHPGLGAAPGGSRTQVAVVAPAPAPETLPTEPPPGLPPHLERVLLNSGTLEHEDASILPLPDHVTLNHLYALSIRDGVMAVATTARYRRKYVTIVLYKPTMV